jgi:Flp pilus assembly protein TadD
VSVSDGLDEDSKTPVPGADDAPDDVLDGLFGSVPPIAPGTGAAAVSDDPVANLFGSSDALPAPTIDDLPSEHELTRWSVTQGSSLFDDKVRDPAPEPVAAAPVRPAARPAPVAAQPAPAPPPKKRLMETQLGVPPPPPAAGSVAAPLPKAPPEPAPRQPAPAPPLVAEPAPVTRAAAPERSGAAFDRTMLAQPALNLERPPTGLASAPEPAAPPPQRARSRPEPEPALELDAGERGPETTPRGGKKAANKGARRRKPAAAPAQPPEAAPRARSGNPRNLKLLVPVAAGVLLLGTGLLAVMGVLPLPGPLGQWAAPKTAPQQASRATRAAPPQPAKPALAAAAPQPATVAAKAQPATVAAQPQPATAAAKPQPGAVLAQPQPGTVPAQPPPGTAAAAKPAPVAAAPAAEPAAEEAETGGGDADSRALLAAQKRLAEDDARGALPLLEALLARDPRNHHAAETMAETMLALDRPADAVRYAREIVKRRPKRASYRLVLGDALLMAGDKPGAEAEWREALKLEPSNQKAMRRLGQ